jgi:hypothetical protein
MKLLPHETELTGKWDVEGREVHRDATCERIEQLIASYLKQIAVSKEWGAWETLLQDPEMGAIGSAPIPRMNLKAAGLLN